MAKLERKKQGFYYFIRSLSNQNNQQYQTKNTGQSTQVDHATEANHAVYTPVNRSASFECEFREDYTTPQYIDPVDPAYI